MGSKVDPGKFDCYANALPTEPMFILLARDNTAPVLVEEWAALRQMEINEGKRPKSDCALVIEARECAESMRRWRAKNDGLWRTQTGG